MRTISVSILASCLAAFACDGARAQDLLAWPCDRAFLDARSSTSPNDTFAVSLFARSTHGYVAVAYFDPSVGFLGKAIFGFYPKSYTKGLVSIFALPTPGEVDVSNADASPSLAATILVNRERYRDVLQRKREWNAREYQLISRDCVELLSDVASALGLTVPDRKEAILPRAFLESIITLNSNFTRKDTCQKQSDSPQPSQPAPSLLQCC